MFRRCYAPLLFALVPLLLFGLVDSLHARAWAGDPYFFAPRLATGDYHALALTADGTVFSWGYNASGQLGVNEDPQPDPVQVPGLADMKAVAAGGYYSAALKADGTVWTWGDNDHGQLGDGTFTARFEPAPVPGLPFIVSLAVGSDHALALASDGTVWSWGNNSSGGLGDGTRVSRTSPVQVPGLTGVVQIAASLERSLALTADGQVYGWGYSGWGELGVDNFSAVITSPRYIAGLDRIVAIESGGTHTVALRYDGTVWTLGSNSVGQLGDGTLSGTRGIPAKVSDLSEVESIWAGPGVSMAAKRDGSMWAWGRLDAVLGSGSTGNRPVPQAVPALSSLAALIPGRQDGWMMALENDGSIWGWGPNEYGQLGDGTTEYRSGPVLSQIQAAPANQDEVAPAISLGAPASGINYGPVGLTWSATDTGSGVATVEIYVSNHVWPMSAVAWSEKPTGSTVFWLFGAEPSTIYARARDRAGNWSSWATKVVQVQPITDPFVPTVDLSVPGYGVTGKPFNISWLGTDWQNPVVGYEVTISENGGPAVLWRSDATSPGTTWLSPYRFGLTGTDQFTPERIGAYVISARAREEDGDWGPWNSRTVTVKASVTNDPYSPTVYHDVPNLPIAGIPFQVGIRPTDAESGVTTWEMVVEDLFKHPVSQRVSGQGFGSAEFTIPSAGFYRIHTVVWDAAGNYDDGTIGLGFLSEPKVPGGIAVTVSLEHRTDASGVEVSVTGPAATLNATTGPDGKAGFLNLPAGTYQVTLTRTPYLAAQRSVTVGVAVETPAVTLRAGDVNQDRAVERDDLDMIVARWGQEAANLDFVPDGVIDLQDLQATACNVGQRTEP